MLTLLLSAIAFAGPGERTAPCLAPPRRAGRPTSVGSATSSVYPLKVHWDRAADEAKGRQALAALETAWRVQVTELGFATPQLPDDAEGPELDLYLSPIGDWNAWVEPGVWDDQVSGDGRMSTFGHIVVDRNLPDDWLDHYVAHEFNHVLQFATDFTEPSFPIWEGTAQAATSWTFPTDERWVNEVADLQAAPWAPILLGDGDAVYERLGDAWLYEYGTALWVMHLDAELGGGGIGGVRLWEEAAQEGWTNEPDVVDAVVAASGRGLGDFLSDVARTRWLTGSRASGDGLPLAPVMAEVAPEAVWSADELPTWLNFAEPVAVTGQGFVEVDLGGSAEPWRVQAGSDAGHHIALLVLLWDAEGVRTERRAEGSAPAIDLAVGEAERAVIAVSNLGPVGFDGDDDPWLDSAVWVEVRAAPRGCGCSGGRSGAWLLGLGLLSWRRRRGVQSG